MARVDPFSRGYSFTLGLRRLWAAIQSEKWDLPGRCSPFSLHTQEERSLPLRCSRPWAPLVTGFFCLCRCLLQTLGTILQHQHGLVQLLLSVASGSRPNRTPYGALRCSWSSFRLGASTRGRRPDTSFFTMSQMPHPSSGATIVIRFGLRIPKRTSRMPRLCSPSTPCSCHTWLQSALARKPPTVWRSRVATPCHTHFWCLSH